MSDITPRCSSLTTLIAVQIHRLQSDWVHLTRHKPSYHHQRPSAIVLPVLLEIHPVGSRPTCSRRSSKRHCSQLIFWHRSVFSPVSHISLRDWLRGLSRHRHTLYLTFINPQFTVDCQLSAWNAWTATTLEVCNNREFPWVPWESHGNGSHGNGSR